MDRQPCTCTRITSQRRTMPTVPCHACQVWERAKVLLRDGSVMPRYRWIAQHETSGTDVIDRPGWYPEERPADG